jgi:hypothetical protein
MTVITIHRFSLSFPPLLSVACETVKILCTVGQYAPWRIATFSNVVIYVEHP